MVKNSSGKDGENQKSDDDKASREWLKDYLRKVYGVSMSGSRSLQQDLLDSGRADAGKIISEEFLFRLLARFNDLDVAPCDGFISMAELQFAINNPRLYFDEKDKHMLLLLKRYYQTIKETAASQEDNDSPHHGVSRQDLEVLASSDSAVCAELRKKLEAEFALKETV